MDAKTPVVSASQMIAAGLASAGAAAATSRFGVAGTLIGAALTTMIITGGSAVLKAYLENIGGRLKNVPETLRANKMRQQAGRAAEQPARQSADEAPTEAAGTRRQRRGERRGQRRGERRGFVARIGSAFEWFRGLPSSAKRSILLKAAIPMAAAFVIAIVAITGTELLGGRTLSCMVWGECYAAADGSSGPRTSFGTVASGSDAVRQAQPSDVVEDPNAQPVAPEAEEGSPGDGGGFFSDDSQGEEAIPEEQPVAPEQPAEPAVPEEQPVVPEEQPVEPVVPEEQPVVPEGVAAPDQ